MEPTTEQASILALASGGSSNLLINALAGTGKTATLELIERALPTQPILYLVFNKRNADEATERMLSTTTVRTFNSMGHRVWAQSQNRKLTVNPKKIPNLLRTAIDELPKSARGPVWDCYWDIVQGVAMAKALGYVPDGKFPNAKRLITRDDFFLSLDEEPDEIVGDMIDVILTRSITGAYDGLVDYNDQIYMPALFGGTFPRFPLVLVDEAQDQSPVNHALLERLARARLIAVGDRWQNIYGFRGAHAAGMDKLLAHYSMTPCDLSVSFRCPSEIVRNARWRVPSFRWFREGGHVEVLSELALDTIPDNAVFLCRNNAPLFRLAMLMLSSGRSVRVAGSDIGPKLLGLMRKLGPESLNREGVLTAIAEWEAARSEKQSKTAGDMAACMRIFAGHGSTLAQAIAYAEHLFAQSGAIQFMTGHKAKGLEFDLVYHLDPWLLREDEQDLNLRYVIQTRSRDRYFEIASEEIR